SWETREYVLGAFQNYLRNQSMFSFWHVTKDHFAPALSNSNFHPKSTMIEVGVFTPTGYGPWTSAAPPILDGRAWAIEPWDAVGAENIRAAQPHLAESFSGKSEKVFPGDVLQGSVIAQCSSTELSD